MLSSFFDPGNVRKSEVVDTLRVGLSSVLTAKTEGTMPENIVLLIDTPAMYSIPTLPNTSQQQLFVKTKKGMHIFAEHSLLCFACENCLLCCMSCIAFSTAACSTKSETLVMVFMR